MNEQVCPICGLFNKCLVEDAENCWCMTIEVLKALIAQLTAVDRDVRCICKNCIEQYEK